jgi:NAD(P) transhydrogenase
MLTDDRFEVLIIGSGPAGQRAAIQAAKLGRRVAVIERADALGGVSANTGTLPSKTARAAAVEITGLRQRIVYGDAYRVKQNVELGDVRVRTDTVIAHERAVVRDQLRRNGVTVVHGSASFADAHTLDVAGPDGDRRLLGRHIIIAVGTTPARPPGVDFDDTTIIDADGLAGLTTLPRAMTIVGGGVIGLEYASVAAALGVRVTLVERADHLLRFVDAQIAEALHYHLRDLGITLRLREEVSAVQRHAGTGATTHLLSGKRIPSDVVLYAAGRQGATADLRLEAAGLEADQRGRIRVDAEYRTTQPNVFAVGDVIGFPALAATSSEQGRLAASAACGFPARSLPGPIPYGIYTIPEISVLGPSEEQLTAAGTAYAVGIARYRELARGAIDGDRHGMLKLLVDPDSRRLLGVHVFGTGATEIVHIGQTVMAAGLPLDYLVDAVFNYPTYSDAYKIAALDAANHLAQLERRAA